MKGNDGVMYEEEAQRSAIYRYSNDRSLLGVEKRFRTFSIPPSV